ncbi:Guanine nucleotide-binding protein G(I)/G(S)/G(O) subunit gamma-11 [Saguinus oedipus]|uniref:Guanine nucleotide-binding protein G(I)/G(S)/G(O) subunit gamma-11 n=1 Tax=Saguinus oedipus TaxID=9490 RepID=A0ABQ9UGV9_SAGOE|nr:Guanine nucleotide-binding protein G(I)/G(S)/G(O) subunit gamma-11 [Saguinus oedipus]
MPALHIEDLPEKEKLKMEVEQLRKEVKLQRQQRPSDRLFEETIQFFLHHRKNLFSDKPNTSQVSKCSEEIKNYIEERSGEDPLVKGIPEDKNPFKEKGSCVIS